MMIKMYMTFTKFTVIALLFAVRFAHSNNFDTSKSIFSPSGKCPQIDYALKSVERSAICIGTQCKDGILLVALLGPCHSSGTHYNDIEYNFRRAESRQHLYTIDSNIVVALTGIQSDCTHILNYLRKRAMNYRQSFGIAIPNEKLADNLGSYLHEITTDNNARPLAVCVIIAGRAPGGAYSMFQVDCSGAVTASVLCSSQTGLDTTTRRILSQAGSAKRAEVGTDFLSLSVQDAWAILLERIAKEVPGQENKDFNNECVIQAIALCADVTRLS